MNIQDAAKEALKKGKCITLPGFKHGAKILPTDGAENCILMQSDGSRQSKYGWQPSARDLISDDWMVVD